MGILRIMSVGRSGVGKSTIGNILLSGDPQRPFDTSTSSVSCTQEAKTITEGDCSYTDVPGIPDTNPKLTAKFYDVIVKEAKKEFNVILFVFKYERQDPAAYKLAEMLFREINKSNAVKILVINDQNNYAFSSTPPTEAEYEVQAKAISDLTKINFTNTVVFTAQTMREKLGQLKMLLSKTQSHKSKHLQSFQELSDYVAELRKNKNYEQEVINEGKRRIEEIQGQLDNLQLVAGGATVLTTAATIASLFTFGATLGIATPTAMAAAAATTAIQLKKAELEEKKNQISVENLDKAARELEEACEHFDELKKALQAN